MNNRSDLVFGAKNDIFDKLHHFVNHYGGCDITPLKSDNAWNPYTRPDGVGRWACAPEVQLMAYMVALDKNKSLNETVALYEDALFCKIIR